jgi:hypothetical protein
MNDSLLNTFQNEPHTREAVKEFMFAQLDKVALERVYERGDTQSIADAKEVIENVFIELKELYGKDKGTNIQSPR